MDFKDSLFERDIILWGVRWYVAYPISYRQLEEMMQERGVEVDHSSLNGWVRKFTPALDKPFRQRKRAVGTSWRLALAPITAKRARKAALRFLRKAIDQFGLPEKITIDNSGANTAAIDDYNTDHETGIELMHMTRKVQLKGSGTSRPAQQSYSLAS